MFYNQKRNILSQIVLILTILFCAITFANSSNLNKELEVIKRLYNEGILSEEEYEKTKSLLLEKSETKSIEEKPKKSISKFQVTIQKKKSKKSYEKAELIFGDYRFYTFRPGGIKV